jgi:hypothetical protein
MQFKLEEAGRDLAGLFNLLAVVEHEVDWAVCGDTCRDCAKERLFASIQRYFDHDIEGAVAVMRDNKQNRCAVCEKRATA